MKNKRIMFLFALLLATMFIITLNSNCYASSDDKVTTTLKVFEKPEYNLRIDASLYDRYKYVVIYTSKGTNSDICHILVSNSEIYFNSLTGYVYFSGESYWHDVYFNSVRTFIDISDIAESDFSHRVLNVPWNGFIGGNQGVFHSSADIYTYDKDKENNRGDLVFKAAPRQVGLSKMMSSINFSEVMSEILKILPIILVALIGILRFRKTIDFLLQTLRKA